MLGIHRAGLFVILLLKNMIPLQALDLLRRYATSLLLRNGVFYFIDVDLLLSRLDVSPVELYIELIKVCHYIIAL